MKPTSPVSNPCLFTDIKIENVGANISATPEGLRLTWKNPNPNKNFRCYESVLRFKTTCARSWEVNTLGFHLPGFTHIVKNTPTSLLSNRPYLCPLQQNITLSEFSYVLRTSRHKEYLFQIKMKYNWRCEPNRQNWTSWTPTLSLGNANDTGGTATRPTLTYVLF